MFNYIIKFLLLIFVSFSLLANADDIKVFDKGLDGNMRIYSVGCPNGGYTTITQMFGPYDKTQRSNRLTGSNREFDLGLEDAEITDTDLSGDSDEIPTGQSPSTISQTASNLKQKFLQLVGQGNSAEVCLYPIGTQRTCKTYTSIDAAAKAACEL